MKRIVSILICLSMSVCLFACGDKDKEDVKSAVSDTVSDTKSRADDVKSDAEDLVSDAKSDAEDFVSDAMSYEESMTDDFGSENIEDDDGIIDDDMGISAGE